MSSNKILDKTGLTYLWSKIIAYLNNVFPAIGDTQMGTQADTITGAIAEHQQDIRDLNSNLDTTTITGSGSYGSDYSISKTGNVVSLSITGITNSTTGQNMTVMTLPQGYRPTKSMRVAGTFVSGSYSASNTVQFEIGASGTVATYSYSAFDNGKVSATYIVP